MLIGTLRDFSLFSIFSIIKSQNKIGTLTVENEEKSVKFYFDRGKIVGVHSNILQPEDSVTSLLIRGNKVSYEEMQNIVQAQNQSLKSLEEITVQSGIISLQDLQEVLYIKAMKTIYSTFLWTNANYQFDSMITDIIDSKNFAPISIDTVLMEAATFVDEWPQVQKRLPDRSLVLARSERERGETVVAAKGKHGGPSASESTHTKHTLLSPEEEAVLLCFEHPTTIADAIKSSKFLELETCKYIINLMEGGFLNIKSQRSEFTTPVLMHIADIQKRQIGLREKSSPLFWPVLAACVLVPFFSYTPKSNDSFNLAISSIAPRQIPPGGNRQTDERAALVYLLNNVRFKGGKAIIPSTAENADLDLEVYEMVRGEAESLFGLFPTDPLAASTQSGARD